MLQYQPEAQARMVASLPSCTMFRSSVTLRVRDARATSNVSSLALRVSMPSGHRTMNHPGRTLDETIVLLHRRCNAGQPGVSERRELHPGNAMTSREHAESVRQAQSHCHPFPPHAFSVPPYDAHKPGVSLAMLVHSGMACIAPSVRKPSDRATRQFSADAALAMLIVSSGLTTQCGVQRGSGRTRTCGCCGGRFSPPSSPERPEFLPSTDDRSSARPS